MGHSDHYDAPLHSMTTDLRPVAALFASILLSAALGMIYVLPETLHDDHNGIQRLVTKKENEKCRLEIIEDIPEDLDFVDYAHLPFRSTWDVYRDLFGNAKKEILIMDSSSNLRASQFTDEYRQTYAKRGNEIYSLLRHRGLVDGLRIQLIDVGKEVEEIKYKDAAELHAEGAVERRTLDMTPLTIQHAKVHVIDNTHALITSANLDHLSLHQKGELGVLVKNCPVFAADVKQTFTNMWRAAGGDTVPLANVMPFNHKRPLQIGDVTVHAAMSPAVLREDGRDDDLAEMVRIIDEAQEKVDISVMDFLPYFFFSDSQQPMMNLTDAITRAVVDRGVQVRLLTASRFIHWRNMTIDYLTELKALGDNIHIRLLSFPYKNVYMDRKSHGKSIVTEGEALISTSNFTPDYFFTDTGLAIIIKDKSPLRNTLRKFDSIFSRYWDSPYAYNLDRYIATCIPVAQDPTMCDAINSPHPDKL